MNRDSYRVALVTPFSWGVPSAVNQHVADLSRELLAMGHRPFVVMSSEDERELYRMRGLFRRPAELVHSLATGWDPRDPCDPRLLPDRDSGPLTPADGVPVLPVGRSFPIRLNGSVANIGVPVDVRSRLERLLTTVSFDVVHVHEPAAPSVSFTAIREARSPVVSSFHLTPVGLMAYELGQAVLKRFYDRLDARIVTSPQASRVLHDFLGGEYRVIPPGARLPMEPAQSTSPADPMLLYVYRGAEHRGLRALLRALLLEPPKGDWRLSVAVHRPSAERWPPRPAPRRLRERVEWHEFEGAEELARLYAGATATILPYLGGEWLLTNLAEALIAGCPVAAPDLPLVRDIMPSAPHVVFFDPSRESSLSACLEQLLGGTDASPSGAAKVGAGPAPVREGAESPGGDHTSAQIAQAIDTVYDEVVGATSRHPGARGAVEPGQLRRPLRPRAVKGPLGVEEGWLYADLHVHTSHSKDCTVPVDVVLSAAREVGLGAVAIADHNTIAGALEAAALTPPDLIVIVAEEVMTQQGEVIGLFLEEEIPKGLTFEETLSLIKEQGGLVYVPHPFDGLRTTPSYRAMVDNLHRIDAIETYNTRNYLASFNVNAERFAAKYNIAAGAGSDSHVVPGLGTAMLRMPRFEGPETFMASLREADIVTRRKSLLYLQSLKLLRSTLDAVLPGT